VERRQLARLTRTVEREVKARFPAGTVRRVAVLQHGDDPAIAPEELMIRVFVAAAGTAETAGADAAGGQQPEDPQRVLDEWARDHEIGMRRMRRELSLRLPPARLLEFTVETAGDSAAAPRITMPDDPALADEPLSTREIVVTAMSLLRTGYVFPDRAEQAATAIEARLAAGEYDDLDEATLAGRLTEHLYDVCADKHLRVRVIQRRPDPDEPAPADEPQPARRRRRGPEGPGPARREPERQHPGNYGIHRVDRLPGNVGYVELRGVAEPQQAGPAIAAAMELVSGTYALIIDLRRNGGGSPHGVVFWCSYLFPDADTHLNDIFDAMTGETRQFWSLAYVPGQRYLDRPVYLLCSEKTFSGGEDFCYTLQAQGRAEVIGEPTGGGAHPSGAVPLSRTLAISVPFGRAVNPVTGTNWEGTGVLPDIPVPADEAYDVAYGMALRHVLSNDVPPPVADEAKEALAALETGTAETEDQVARGCCDG
jgi:hypothetical protein